MEKGARGIEKNIEQNGRGETERGRERQSRYGERMIEKYEE